METVMYLKECLGNCPVAYLKEHHGNCHVLEGVRAMETVLYLR